MTPTADTIGIIIHTSGLNLRSIMPVRSWKIGHATIAPTTARIATNEIQFTSTKRIEGEGCHRRSSNTRGDTVAASEPDP